MDIPKREMIREATQDLPRGGEQRGSVPFAPRMPEEEVAAPSPRSERAGLSKEDATRFRQMVDAHFDFIWRSLRGLGVPPSTIDDAAQHVFWTASQKLASITIGSERAYLFATARGTAANARRARQRSRELLGDDALALRADTRPDPEEAASTREARRLLDQVLDGLDEDLREVFVLFELEGQTTAEIAALLGTPMGTVASRLRRAREEFRTAARRLQAGKGGSP